MFRKVIDDLLNDPEFRLMDRSTMKGAWWTPPEIPERYVRLAYIAYKRGKITKSRLAQHLKTSLLDIDDLLREYGLDTAEIDQTIKVRYS